MPDPLFFFSYAPANRDPYLTRLFEDLSLEVRIRLIDVDEPGFIEGELPLMEERGPAIDALQSCQAFVALLSPAYFQSARCGKEWELFQRRIESAEGDRGRIMPIIWIPLGGQSLPAFVSELLQREGLDSAEEYMSKGLRSIMRLGQPRYSDIVDRIAETLASHTRKPPLPQSAERPSLAHVRSAFSDFAPPAPTSKSVVIVPFAGSRVDMSAVRRSVEGYGAMAGQDWRPFFPASNAPAEMIAQRMAAQEGYFYGYVAPDQELFQRIVESRSRNQPVIVLLDPWTALLAPYREILQRLDALKEPNVSFVVLENEDDEESRTHIAQLRSNIRSVMQYSAAVKEPRLETVGTEAEFRARFSRTLVDSFLRMLSKSEPLPRTTPTIALPKIGGPGSQR